MGAIHIITGIVMIFIVTAVFAPMIFVLSDNIYPLVRTNLTAQGRQSVEVIHRLWLLIPYLLIIGAIMYMMAGATKEEYGSTRRREEGYY